MFEKNDQKSVEKEMTGVKELMPHRPTNIAPKKKNNKIYSKTIHKSCLFLNDERKKREFSSAHAIKKLIFD